MADAEESAVFTKLMQRVMASLNGGPGAKAIPQDGTSAAERRAVAARDNPRAVMQFLDELLKRELFVGIPENSPRDDSELSNAEIAYILETGDPASNLPPRPFMTNGMAKAESSMTELLTEAAFAAVQGRRSEARRLMEQAGEVGRDAIRSEILTGDYAPLAPATVADRRARGNASEKPLFDTGQMYDAVTYQIKRT
jgi:hypothetical protein